VVDGGGGEVASELQGADVHRWVAKDIERERNNGEQAMTKGAGALGRGKGGRARGERERERAPRSVCFRPTCEREREQCRSTW